MSTDLAEVQQGGKLTEWLFTPENVSRFDRLLGDVIGGQDYLTRVMVPFMNADIRACTVASQLESIHKCATLALFPDLQHVALIPRKQGQVTICTMMIQWQGYKTLFERSPDVLEASATLVHVGDEFGITDGRIDHRYNPLSPQREFLKGDDLQGGYLTITFRNNRPQKYHFVTSAYVERCRRAAQTQGVWNQWYEQMALKTVYRSAWSRRIINFDPILQKRLMEAGELDDDTLGSDPMIVDQRPTGLPTAMPVKRAETIAQRLTQDKAKKAKEPKQTAPPEEETKEPDPSAPETTEPEILPPQEGAAPPAFDEAKASKGWSEFKEMYAAAKTIGPLKQLLKYIQGEKCTIKFSAGEREEAIRTVDYAINEMAAQS